MIQIFPRKFEKNLQCDGLLLFNMTIVWLEWLTAIYRQLSIRLSLISIRLGLIEIRFNKTNFMTSLRPHYDQTRPHSVFLIKMIDSYSQAAFNTIQAYFNNTNFTTSLRPNTTSLRISFAQKRQKTFFL